MNSRWQGYTLIELLIAVTLFSVLLGTIFSVFSTMRQAERFRDENVRLTQAASFSFEPIIRAVQAGNATEAIRPEQEQRDAYGLTNDCAEVRGFYAESPSANQKLIKTEGEFNIATIREEKVFNPDLGMISKWVKYVYSWNRLDNTIEETVWEVANPQSNSWPTPLSSCGPSAWINIPDRTRVLTPSDVEVKDFRVRIVAPVLGHDENGLPQHFIRSPFVTITLTVGYPAGRRSVAVPVTFRSTVVPTFSYGEQRNVQ